MVAAIEDETAWRTRMKSTVRFFSAALVAIAMIGGSVLAGCGDDESPGGAAGDSSSQQTASCCLGESFFACPDADAAQACFDNGSPGDCARDSSKDQACK
jgi:hypothetical protein